MTKKTLTREELEGQVAAQEERIIDLEGQLRDANQVGQDLAAALQERQREIAEGREALAKTANKLNGNGEPLVHAPVLLVRREEARIGEPKEYVAGAHVRYVSTADAKKVAFGIGTIEKLGEKPGFVQVKFDNGTETCFIGLPEGTEPEEGSPSQVEIELVRLATVVIKHDGRNMELPLPPHLTIKPGDTVRVGKAQNIVDVTSVPATGPICRVKRAEGDTVEVEHGGSSLTVLKGDVPNVAKDDRVILDVTSSVCLVNLGKGEQNYHESGETGVEWDDIGGQDEAKRALREAIEDPLTDKELFEFFGMRPPKGILLFGPPGNGKTMLIKAAATAVARAYTGQGSARGLIYVKGPEILIKWVGESEAQVRQLFAAAKAFKEKHGYPAVIAIDECEAVLRKRGTSVSSDVGDTVVPAFLAEMDGLVDSGAILILCTNRPDTLDPAVVRDGRVDRKIELKRPGLGDSEIIFNLHMRKTPIKGSTREELAHWGSTEMFDSKYHFAEVVYHDAAGQPQTKPMGLGQLISGAMIASVVAQAKVQALRRCKAAGNKTGEGEGVTKEDMAAAIASVFQQNLALNHQNAAEDYLRDEGGRVVGIRRMRAGSAN